MGIWKNIEFQGKTYGLKNLTKKRRNKNKLFKKIWKLKQKKGPILTEGQLVQRDFEIMMKSSVLSEKTKVFLLKLRGSYGQFGRFTSKQFAVFKKIWWEMKDREKEVKSASSAMG